MWMFKVKLEFANLHFKVKQVFKDISYEGSPSHCVLEQIMQPP